MKDIAEYETAFFHAIIYCAALVEDAFWYVASALGILMRWLERPFIAVADKDTDGNSVTEVREMNVEIISNEAGERKIRKCGKIAILNIVEKGVEEEEVNEREDIKSSSYIMNRDSLVDGRFPSPLSANA